MEQSFGLSRNAMKSVVRTVCAACAIMLIGWLDVVTGAAFGLSLFYLGPIVASALWVGRSSAIAIGGLAACTWFVADLITADVPVLASTWNGVTRLTIYVGIGLLLATVRRERDALRALSQELRTVAEREAHLARTDALTGVANSRYFNEALERAAARSRRDGRPVALAFVDLDNFKRVNDSLGHAAGDELLCRFSRALEDSVRASDLVGRLGGDEFAVLLSDADVRAAGQVLERFLVHVEEIARDYPGCELGASVGITSERGESAVAEPMLRDADAAMYLAKQNGKGHVVTAGGERPAALPRVARG